MSHTGTNMMCHYELITSGKYLAAKQCCVSRVLSHILTYVVSTFSSDNVSWTSSRTFPKLKHFTGHLKHNCLSSIANKSQHILLIIIFVSDNHSLMTTSKI